MYYEIRMNSALLDKRIKEIKGVSLSLLILFAVAICQNSRMPLEGAVAMSSHIFGETSGEEDVFAMNGVGGNILPPDSCMELEKVKENELGVTEKGFFVEPDIVKTAWLPKVAENVFPVDTGINMTDDSVESQIAEEGKDVVSEAGLDMLVNPAQNEADSEEEIKDGDSSVMILDGFICDSSGKIIGCDGVSIADGVLRLPSDEMCTGIAAGALTSFGGSVCEIYIPANITMIENGAFDGLEGLAYIEVHPDNPVYGSSAGILFEK